MAPYPKGEHKTYGCREVPRIIDLSNIPTSPAPIHMHIPGREYAGIQHRQLEETWHQRLQNIGSLIPKISLWKQHNIFEDALQGPGPQLTLQCYSRSGENHVVLKPHENLRPPSFTPAMSTYREKPECPKRFFVPEELELGLTEKILVLTTIL